MQKSLFNSAPVLFVCLLILCLSVKAQTYLTFSEVMFYPAETNGEFIEVVNNSLTDTINLTGYKIKYHTSSSNNLAAYSGGMKLFPGKLAIILQGSYDFENGVYKNLIPPETIILRTTGNNFGSSGMANTTGRSILIISPAGDTIDSYTYSANNSAGISDEKIILTDGNSALNWGNSKKINGTPGYKNSIAPLSYDVSVNMLVDLLNDIHTEDTVEILMNIKNSGMLDAENLRLDLYSDVNKDSSFSANEIILSENVPFIGEGDSVNIEYPFYVDSAGTYSFMAEVLFIGDEDESNNKSFIKFTSLEKPAGRNEILINEIMYAPLNDEPEWIEIINKSNRKLNIKNWKLGDSNSSVEISGNDFFINPGEYVIVSDEETINSHYNIPCAVIVKSLPNFNNTGDGVLLFNPNGDVIDSLQFTPDWGGQKGKSLERISIEFPATDKINWGTCESALNATPGRINSLSLKSYDLNAKNIILKNEFFEIGKQAEVKIEVENTGAFDAFIYSVHLFQKISGNESLFNKIESHQRFNLQAGGTDTILFVVGNLVEGINSFRAVVDFNKDEYRDNDTINFGMRAVKIEVYRNDIVINEIMFKPQFPENEWVEIYNGVDREINLNGFYLWDKTSQVRITNIDKIISPGEFLVISRDSSIFSIYENLSNVIVIDLPPLNDSNDKIVLTDSLSRIIDSLEYKGGWCESGKSLERVDVSFVHVDSTNWRQCVLQKGGTPAKINSVSKKNINGAVAAFYCVPPEPVYNSMVEFFAEVINKGRHDFNYELILKEKISDGTLIKLESSGTIFLKSGESDKIKFYFKIDSISSARSFYAEIIVEGDEELYDNKMELTLIPGYPAKSILINEIMFYPAGGEPEWIEIFNKSDYEIDLRSWVVSDVLQNPIESTLQPLILKPNCYAVISKDSSIVNFHRKIESQILINGFANLNNDSDGVIIKDSRGITIDSVIYNYKVSAGRSIERISVDENSNDENNWGCSNDIELSTPGRINSVTRKNFDLCLMGLGVNKIFPVRGDELKLKTIVKNNGAKSAENFEVEFYLTEFGGSFLISKEMVEILLPADSIEIISSESFSLAASVNAFAKIIFAADEDSSNNKIAFDIICGSNRGDVLINEIMFNPLDGEAEWIEIFNNSKTEINLKNWRVSDIISASQDSISNKDAILPAGCFAVLTPDTNNFQFIPPENFYESKFGTLGNSIDGIRILDARGAIIDSVEYSGAWCRGKGKSIERISAVNCSTSCDSTIWKTSLSPNGATPGIPNSYSDVCEYKNRELTINEILYEPGSSNSEFVEFYNNSGGDIQLGGIVLKINSDKFIELTSSLEILESDNYFVLASDSGLVNCYPISNDGKILSVNGSLSLPNDGAVLIVKDFLGNVLDSLEYKPDWHNKNFIQTRDKSLERINPGFNSCACENWSTSVAVEGATPLRQNSIYTKIQNLSSNLEVNPNPFSPDSDGFEDFTVIGIKLNKPISQVRAKLFDSMGRLVRVLEQNMSSASNATIIFDGLDNNGKALRIGIYILLVEAFSSDGSKDVFKKAVVIARKL